MSTALFHFRKPGNPRPALNARIALATLLAVASASTGCGARLSNDREHISKELSRAGSSVNGGGLDDDGSGAGTGTGTGSGSGSGTGTGTGTGSDSGSGSGAGSGTGSDEGIDPEGSGNGALALVANDQMLVTNEDQARMGQLTATSESGSGSLVYSIVTNGSKGTMEIQDPSTGAFTYTPESNANGSDSITFQVTDGENTAVGKVDVSINPVNDVPTLSTISVLGGAAENAPFSIPHSTLLSSSDAMDVDGDRITFVVESVVTGTLRKGSANVVPNNTTVGSGESLVWTPPSNRNGTVGAFRVKAYDGVSTSANAVLVQVSTTDVNNAPTLSSINVLPGAIEDTPFLINYSDLIGASDEADPDGDVLSFRVEQVLSGSMTKNGLAVVPGVTTVAAGETLRWVPAAGANGNLNAMSVRVQDSHGATSASAVNVVVATAAVNDAPSLTTIQTLSGAVEDAPFAISYEALRAASNASDSDGDAISFRIEAVVSGTLTLNGAPVVAGSTLLSSGGILSWTSAPNASGTLSAFVVRAFDGSSASSVNIPVRINVAAANDAPLISLINPISGASEDTPFDVTHAMLAAAANESDPEGAPVSFRVESVTSGVVLKGGVPVVAGATIVSAGESLAWTPDQNANGSLSAFKIRAYDGVNASLNEVQVVIVTAAAADAPMLSRINELVGASQGIPYSISYAALRAASDASDADGDVISFRVEAISSGTLTKGGVAVVPGTTRLASGESLVWTPAAGAGGSTNAFTVRAFDGALLSASAVQVVVSTSVANRAPTLSSVSTLTGAQEDAPFSINHAMLLAAADEADPDGNSLSFRIESVQGGNLTKNGVAVTDGVTLLSPGETVIWRPGNNQFGVLPAFSVRAFDGSLASANAVPVQVSVAGVNDSPNIASVSTLSGAAESRPFTISHATMLAAASVSDVDGNPISFRLEAVVAGTLTKNGSNAIPYSTILAAGESWVWTPPAGSTGNVLAFHVRAYDGSLASGTTAPVTISVGAVNDPPVLTSIAPLAGATEDVAYTISYSALATAADESDPEGTPVSFQIGSVLAGTLTKNGTPVVPGSTLLSAGENLVWTPVANSNGSINVFTVRAYDGELLSSGAPTVAINVASVNDLPTLSGIANQTTILGRAVGPLSFSVGDVETAAGSLSLSGNSSNTTLVPSANITFGGSGSSRTVTVAPAAGSSGTATITVTVQDSSGGTRSTSFALTVNGAINLEVPIEILADGIHSRTSSYTYERTRTTLNTNDFDGAVTYSFEINGFNQDTASRSVYLVNSANTTVATLTIPVGTSYRRLRTTFTPTPGTDNYRVRMGAAGGSSRVYAKTARIIVRQTGATKTRLYYSLGSHRDSTQDDIPLTGATLDYTNSTSWTQRDAGAHAIFHKDAAALQTIAAGNAWNFEVILHSSSASGRAYVALFNRRTGAMVAGTQVSTTGTYSGLVTFPDNATNFTNLDEFEARIRQSDGSYTAGLFKAQLSVKLENLSRGRVYYQVGREFDFGTNPSPSVESFTRALIETNAYTRPTTYFEAVGSDSNGGYFDLVTSGTSDTGNTGTVVAGTRINPPSTKGRVRTGPISIVSGNRYMNKQTWNGGTLRVTGAYVVIDFGN